MRDRFKIGKCRRYALSIIVLSLFISAISAVGIAQESQPVSLSQASNPAAGTNATQSRKPTLQELYAMFFTYAAHVETRSIADEKLGIDRSFYRQHLQIDSGLTTEEYAQVLAAAQRFVAIDTDMKKQIADLNNTGGEGESGSFSSPLVQSQADAFQIKSLFAQSTSSLVEEIANVHQVLAQDRVEVLDNYLQDNYHQTVIGTAPEQVKGTSTTLPQKMVTSATTSSFNNNSGAIPPKAQPNATPDDIVINGGVPYFCGYVLDALGNYFSMCVDSQMSYLDSGDLVELYSASSWSMTFVDGSLACVDLEGNLIVNNNSAIVYHYTKAGVPGTDDVHFNFGNGANYALDTRATIYYFVNGTGGCNGGNWASQHYVYPPSVTIHYPSIQSISPQLSIQPGFSERFQISGSGLISPFQNNPTVTDQNKVCNTPLSEYSFNYANNFVMTSLCTISESAQTGNDTITVNNGFGSGTTYITIAPPAPTISGISVSGSSASNVLQAGPTTQTVTLTGENFGSTPPTITVATGSEYVSIVSGSVATPSLARAKIAPRVALAGSKMRSATAAVSPSVEWNSQQTVSFKVLVSSDAPAGSVTFQLRPNDGQTDAVDSPAVTLDPFQAPVPVILDGTFSDNSENCSAANTIADPVNGDNTQMVWVGQLIQFTGCIPSSVTSLSPLLSITSSSWTVISSPGSNFQNDAVAGLSLGGNVVNNTTGGTNVPQSGGYIPFTATNCEADAYCDFNTLYYVMSGQYVFQYSYSLSNGTNASATVTYYASGPTANSNSLCSSTQTICAYADNPAAEIKFSGSTAMLNMSGINFTVSTVNPDGYPTTNPSAFIWVQILTPGIDKARTASGIVPYNCVPIPNVSICTTGLDNTYPYAISTDSLVDRQTGDAPGIGLSQTEGEAYELFQAQMYLLWDPSLGSSGEVVPGCSASSVWNDAGTVITSTSSTCAGSIPVPLGSIAWGYCGDAINTLTTQQTSPTGVTTGFVINCSSLYGSVVGGAAGSPQFIPATGSSSFSTWTGVQMNTPVSAN